MNPSSNSATNSIQIDTLELPLDWQKIKIHEQANKIGKRFPDSNMPKQVAKQGIKCQQCGRNASYCPSFKLSQSETETELRYGSYGPNCILLFGLMKRILIFMSISVLIFCLPLFILNLLGVICRQSQNACQSQDVIYFWSTYNVLGQNPGSLPHHVLWFVFSIFAIIFSLYLRKYAMTTYKQINNRNHVDSSYALILRSLPDNTSQDNIIQLMEAGILKEYQTQTNIDQVALEGIKHIKVKNVILLKKLKQIMQVNDQNVKDFKEHYKKQKKGEKVQATFIPKPLPQPNQFANAAIVRFSNNKTKDYIMRTIKINFLESTVKYFFPSYHPKTQYQIHGQRISIEFSPEPSDIQWQNFGINQHFRIARKIIANSVTILLILLSSGISLGVTIGIQKILAATGIQPSYLTVILTLIVIIVNLIIRKIIQFFINKIRLDTITDQNCEQLYVIVISLSINLGFFSMFAPIIAKLPAFIYIETKSSSSFPLVMFISILLLTFLQSTIGFLVTYFDLNNKILRFLHKKGLAIKTQTQAYNKFKNVEVPFVLVYAYQQIILWFSFLYAVVSPICAFFATIGLILYYILQKILYSSRYSIPIYGGPRLNQTYLNLIDYLPFLMGLFNLYLYQTSQNRSHFPSDPRVYGIVSTNIIIGAIHAVIPYQMIFRHFYNENESLFQQSYDSNKIFQTFENSYPVHQIDKKNSTNQNKQKKSRLTHNAVQNVQIPATDQ